MARLLAMAVLAAALVGCSNPDPGAAENTARTNQSAVVEPLTPEKAQQMNTHPLPPQSASSTSSSSSGQGLIPAR